MKTSVPTTRPPDGFAPWWDFPPPHGIFEYVEAWRKGDIDTCLISPDKMHPLMNVHGLWWRPVKEYGEVEQ